MKKILTFILLILGVTMLQSAKKAEPIVFAETAYDFGTIADTHEPVVHEFEFTNTTDEPVAILSVSSGCGCTRPEYPTKPVKPGKSEKIKVTFLPAHQRGDITKDVKVRYRSASSKSSGRVTLRITGRVTPTEGQ